MRRPAALLLALVLTLLAPLGPLAAAGPAAAGKAPCDLVVEAGTVLPMDEAFSVLTDGAVAVKDGKVVAVGPRAEVAARFEAVRTVRRPDSVVMPGLVNTHTHAAMNLLRGIADDKPLMEWLNESIFPAEARNVSPEFVRAGTTLACLEMIRGGTTTFADMYYYESDVAAAVDACGLRGVLGETWIDFPVPGHKDLAETKAVTKAFLEKWKGHRRVVAAVAPHAPYTCGKETLLAAREMADAYGAPLLIHVSETLDEQKTIREKYGTTPVEWLDAIGFLGPRVVAAHGVWLSWADLARMAAKGASLSHNPESNMKLGSGAAPVAAARKAGVVVGLGTDGVAGSNNDLDMMEAMDFAGKLAKVTALDPTALPARDLLRMATSEGAKALGLGDVTGSLEPGKAADLIAVDLDDPRTWPVYDVASTVVYAAKAGDVSLTVVDGRVLWDGRTFTTLDPVAVRKEATAFRERIVRSLAKPAAAPQEKP